MSRIVPVVFPVLHRYRPPRVRNDRHGFGRGEIAVALREAGRRPQEIAYDARHAILAVEGKAWSVLRAGDVPIPADAFAAYLSQGDAYRGIGEKVMASWARRSPLLYVSGEAQGRSGIVDLAGAAFAADGTERCARDVRAFLDDRVRLHEGRVLVREERVVGLHDLDRARPKAVFGPFPRDEGVNYYGSRACPVVVRPDRLAAAWELHGRPMRGEVPTGAWDALAGIDPLLLGDDDVAWVANRMPALCLGHMRSSWYAIQDRDDTAEAAHRELTADLKAHARLGLTGSVTGERVEPCLRTVRHALSMMVERRTEVRAESDEDLRTFVTLHRLVDREFLPRLAGPVRPEDEAELAGLVLP